MDKKLKIMFVPMEFVGHINSNIGLAQTLRERGHQVIFAIDSSHQNLVTSYGFDVEVIDNRFFGSGGLAEIESTKSAEFGIASKRDWRLFFTLLLKIKSIAVLYFQMVYSYFNKDTRLKEIINEIEPDLFIVDDIFCYPSLIYAKKPWVWLFSANPLGFYQDFNLPPPIQGLPSDKKTWRWTFFNYLNLILCEGLGLNYKLMFYICGYSCNPENRYFPDSPYLNLYCYPKELDYDVREPKLKNTYRLDTFMRPDLENTKIPVDLKLFIESDRKAKLIYVSLGSFCSSDVKFMKNLVNMLYRTEHRYIISKGYFADEYELLDNMWGDKYVPQKQIIPLVDLVITHGGNNSVIEAFSYGKPMIVIPLWLDQYDNAQRIHELNYGTRLDFHSLDEEGLLGAIERVLNDQSIKERLSVASERILNDNKLIKAAEMIEKLDYVPELDPELTHLRENYTESCSPDQSTTELNDNLEEISENREGSRKFFGFGLGQFFQKFMADQTLPEWLEIPPTTV